MHVEEYLRFAHSSRALFKIVVLLSPYGDLTDRKSVAVLKMSSITSEGDFLLHFHIEKLSLL